MDQLIEQTSYGPSKKDETAFSKIKTNEYRIQNNDLKQTQKHYDMFIYKAYGLINKVHEDRF